jgi:hypothetical protein
MIIIDTAAVVFLLVVVALAGLLGLVALGVGLGRTLVANRPVRLARHESVAHYYGHLAIGH